MGKLIKDLGIDRVPVVVVLDVTEQKVEVVGRVLGYYPPEETLRRLQPLLDKLPNVSASTPARAAQQNEAPRAASRLRSTARAVRRRRRPQGGLR